MAAVILAAFSVLFSSAFSAFNARADQTEPPEVTVIKHKTNCAYTYFDYPSALFATGNSLTVADGSSLYSFDTDNLGKQPERQSFDGEYADKIAKHGSTLILLSNNVLSIGETKFEGITDFDVYGDYVYAIDGLTSGKIYKFSLDSEIIAQTEAAAYGEKLFKIAAGSDGVYVSKYNRLNRYLSDIVRYSVSDGNLTEPNICFTSSNNVLQMCAKSSGIFCLTRKGITAYELTGNNELVETAFLPCTDVAAISSSGNKIYGISELKSVFEADSSLSARKEILASAHDEKGFFSQNAGFTTRKNTVAVADELNNRVQLIRNDGTEIITDGISLPKAVAIGYSGNIFVAHSRNKISVFDGESLTLKRAYAAENLGDIEFTALVIDSDNNLYALAQTGQVYKADDLPFEPIGSANVKSIAVSQKDNTVYVSDGTTVRKLGNDAQIFTCADGITDFCTDHNGSFYVLTPSGDVKKFERGSSSPVLSASTSAKFVYATAIEMNTVRFTQDISLSYGDLLVSDTGAHAIKCIKSDVLKVNDGFEMNDNPPEIDGSRTEYNANRKSKEIIFTVASAEIYPQAAEINALPDKLGNDMRVIMPAYDSNANFNLVIADNLADGSGDGVPAVTGYVHKSFVKEKLAYKPAKTEVCYSFIGVKVYKYPTYNSPVVDEHEKDTRYKLLDFVYSDNNGNETYGYTDNRGTVWYRVAYDGTDGKTYEGYVIGKYIRLRGEIPNDRNVYPRVNAKIISLEKGKNIPATLFDMDDDGNIKEVDDASFPPLAVGTEVEVVGTFDSSEKFTLIKYYHDGLGTVQFYVYTANLEYDGLNMVAVVAVIIIILTVILGGILVARFLYVKRNRRLGGETKI